jgi:hypothetical protein
MTDQETIAILHKALLDIQLVSKTTLWEYNQLMLALNNILVISDQALQKIDA